VATRFLDEIHTFFSMENEKIQVSISPGRLNSRRIASPFSNLYKLTAPSVLLYTLQVIVVSFGSVAWAKMAD